MKTTFKAIVLAASLSMIAGSAFAANTDLTILTDVAAPVLTTASASATLVQADFKDTALFGGDIALVDNVAVVAQFGTGTQINYALIDQSAGINNAAVIVQDNTANNNTAAIVQVGTANRAFINQR